VEVWREAPVAPFVAAGINVLFTGGEQKAAAVRRAALLSRSPTDERVSGCAQIRLQAKRVLGAPCLSRQRFQIILMDNQ